MSSDLVPNDLIELGRVVSSYGVKGLLKIYPYSGSDTTLLVVYDWWLLSCSCQFESCKCENKHKNYSISHVKSYKDLILAKFLNINSKEEADNLKGYRIFVSRSLFPIIKDNEYYWIDLIGCNFYGCLDGVSYLFGIVSEVFDNGSHAILKIVLSEEIKIYKNIKHKYILVPFVDNYIDKVDLSNHKILSSWQIDY